MTVTADVKAGYSETPDAVMKIGARDYSGRCGANLEERDASRGNADP